MFGMVHQRQRLALGLEPRDDLVRIHPRLDDLDGDAAADWLRLLGEVDGTHAALAEELDDTIRSDVAGKQPGERAIDGFGPGLLFSGSRAGRNFRVHDRRLHLRRGAVARDRFDGIDDGGGGDTEVIQQFLGLSAARNLAHGEPVHGEPAGRQCGGDRIAHAAGRVVILDRDHAAVGRARGGQERVGVDRLHRVASITRIAMPVLGEQVERLQRLEHRDAGADDGDGVACRLAQDLGSADGERFVRVVE